MRSAGDAHRTDNSISGGEGVKKNVTVMKKGFPDGHSILIKRPTPVPEKPFFVPPLTPPLSIVAVSAFIEGCSSSTRLNPATSFFHRTPT